MKILSFLSNDFNVMLQKSGVEVKCIGETGIIETIYHSEEIKDELKINEFINTLDDIEAGYDAVVFDFLSILNNHYLIRNKVLNEETIDRFFSSEQDNIFKKKIDTEVMEIFKESFKVITNKLLKYYHSNQIIIVKTMIDKENEEDERKERLLSKIYEEVDKIIPGCKYLDLSKEEIDENDKFNLVESIQQILDSTEIFKREQVHRSIKNIRYVFQKSAVINNKKLIVIFSSFSTGAPKYNYMTFLKAIDCNKLFILDDYGEKGCYYMGLDGDLEVETSVMSLISSIMASNNIQFRDVISIGSSKGGSAALYYGFKYGFGNVIAGAPQYKIGTYLLDLSIKKYAEDIFGNSSISSRIKYDNMIRLILTNDNHTKAVILTGDGDNQYKKVLKELEYENDDGNYGICFDKCDIQNHSDIAKVFPDYLIKSLNEILGGMGKYSSTPIFKIIKRLRRGE